MSRRAQPRVWLRAVGWLLGAGLHPRATAATRTVAEDLARRMDYGDGTVLYDLDGTASRTGRSRATVKRHVRILRELGALAWRRHGSRTNLHLPGRKYAGTATIYAATIPPSWDAAMGNRLSGHGYGARVIGVTEEGRSRAVAEAKQRAANRQSSRAGSLGCEPQSLGRNPNVGKAEVDGGVKDTRVRSRRTTTQPSNTTSTRARRASGRRSPLQVARDIAIARQVRPLVGWTQRESLRRLTYALRPLIDQRLDAHDIAAELHAWHLDWRLAHPAAYITATLRRRAEQQDADGLPPAPVGPTGAFQAAVAETADQGPADAAVGEEESGLESLTRAEVIALRSAAVADPGLVVAAIEGLGEYAARTLYTGPLVDAALLRTFGGGRMVVHG